MVNSLRVLVTELIREPVKQAVREALREEANVESTGSDGLSFRKSREQSGSSSLLGSSERTQHGRYEESEESGRSRMLWMLMLAGAVGAGVAMRRRRSSGGAAWSQSEAEDITESDTGYSSEGEMQTTETGGTEMDETSPEQ